MSTIPSYNLSIKEYMEDVSRTSRLSVEEERRLATILKAARSLDPASPELSASERVLLREAEAAKQVFIESNLRLVLKVAKAYQYSGIPLQDLIQEGNLGLITAVGRFDIDMGFKFSTYAVHWIKQGIQKAVSDQGKPIRLPANVNAEISSIKRARSVLENRFGREPTLKEISVETGIDVEKMEDLLVIDMSVSSLDAPTGSEGDSSLGDSVADPAMKDIGIDVEGEELAEAMRRFLRENVSGVEYDLLAYRFGVGSGNGNGHTIEETAKKFDIRRERVRQLEMRVLRKLKSPEVKGRIADELEA